MNENSSPTDVAQPDWLDRLESWAEKTRAPLADGLGGLLEHEATVKPQKPRYYTATEIEGMFPDGPVLLTVEFSGAELGSWNFLFPRSLAAMIGDLAMMGQGNVPFDESVHLSGLSDVWGQVLAGLEPQLGALAGGQISVGAPDVSLDPTAFLKELRSSPVIRWDVSIKDAGEGFVLHGVSPAFGAILKPVRKPPPLAARAAMPEPSSIPKPKETPVARSAMFEEFMEETTPDVKSQPRNLDLLLDINLPITIELGRTTMVIRDVLQLGPGSVIELDKMSGEPVDLYVNDKKFARGEVVVIEENFGVRITELIRLDERLKALGA